MLQEANLKLWNKRSLYQDGSNFKAWAFKIARFNILVEYRDRLVFVDEEVLHVMEQEETASLEGNVGRLAGFQEIYMELPADHKALLAARYEKGKSLVDYAERMGIKPDAAHKAISRLRRKMYAATQERLPRQ
ncbi:MAG: RNA polymerase sigma-70 factor (ECF subfamily) [Kiritimatiellia bacterium]